MQRGYSAEDAAPAFSLQAKDAAASRTARKTRGGVLNSCDTITIVPKTGRHRGKKGDSFRKSGNYYQWELFVILLFIGSSEAADDKKGAESAREFFMLVNRRPQPEV
jgi:hypothetical protein